MPGTHPPIFCLGDVNGNIPPILLRTFGYSRPILVALRSLSLKPISYGYKTPPIRFCQAGGQSAHKARPRNLELALTPQPQSPTSLVIITSTACSTIQAHNRRSTHISAPAATHCHLTSNYPRLCPSSVNVLKHSVFASLFLTYSSVTLLRLRGLRNSSAIRATLKIFDRHRLTLTALAGGRQISRGRGRNVGPRQCTK